MTQKEIDEQIRILREVSKKVCKSKATARKFLRDSGIMEMIENPIRSKKK